MQDREPQFYMQASILSFSNTTWKQKLTPKLPQTSGCISQQGHHQCVSFTAERGMCIVTDLLTFLREVSNLLFLYILTPNYTVLCFPHFPLFYASIPQSPLYHVRNPSFFFPSHVLSTSVLLTRNNNFQGPVLSCKFYSRLCSSGSKLLFLFHITCWSYSTLFPTPFSSNAYDSEPSNTTNTAKQSTSFSKIH